MVEIFYDNILFCHRLSLLVLVLLLVGNIPIRGEGNIEPDKSAVLFRNKGTVELSGRAYHVLLDISIDNLLLSVKPIGEAVQAVSTGIHNTFKSLSLKAPKRTNKMLEVNTNQTLGNPFTSLSYTLSSSMQEHITFLLAELKNKHRSLLNFLQSMGDIHLNPLSAETHRSSRGLINAGGSVLQWLFGIATDDELSSTNEILDRLASLSEETRQTVNLHSTILNETYIHFEDIGVQVNRVKQCLSQVTANIVTLTNHISTLENQQYTITHSLIMTNSLMYASTALSDLSNQFTNLKIGLSKFREGFISTEIIPPSVILNLSHQITLLNLKPIYPSNPRYLPLLYKYIRVSPLPHHPLAFVVSIPLEGDPRTQLELFELISLPVSITNTLTISYSNLPKYLAVSDDRRSYIEYESMSDCRHHSNTYLCPVDRPVYRDTAPSCALSLLKGNTKFCNKHFSHPLPRAMLTKSSAGWLYSISKEDKFTITCAGGTTEIKVSPGSGRLSTGDNCKISGSEFTLPSSAISHSEPMHVNISLVTPFSLNLTYDELEDVSTLNNSELLTDVMKLTNQMPLTSLRTELRNLAYIQKMRKLNTISGSAGLSLSILSFIMVLAITVILVVFCKVARERHQQHLAHEILRNDLDPTHIRPRSTFSVAMQNLQGLNEPQVNIRRDTMTSNVPEIRSEPEAIALVPRSPTIHRPTVSPRSIQFTDRHTCTLSDSQALTEVEILHFDANCPNNPNMPQRSSAPE